MIDTQFFEETAKKLCDCVPPGLNTLKADLEKNFKTVLQATFSKLDLVTREELDAQKAVLARTREKIDAIEKELSALAKKKKK